MNRIRMVLALALTFALAAFGLGLAGTTAQAQYRTNDRRMLSVVKRLETRADRFSGSLDAALDRSPLDGTEREDEVNALADEFEDATDRLRKRTEDGVANARDMDEVLRRAMRLEMFMRANRLTPRAQSDWAQVRGTLDELARNHNVVWVWTADPTPRRVDAALIRRVIDQLEQRADEFRESFADALDAGPRDGTSYEDYANRVVATFEQALDRLEDLANGSGGVKDADVRTVLNNALSIEDFMRKNRMTPRARRDWARVKTNLDELAYMQNVAWVWTGVPVTTVSVPNNNSGVSTTAQNPRGEAVGMAGDSAAPTVTELAREVRHELLSDLPYYGVFDWIEFEVRPDRTVVLRGSVTSPPDTKSRAEAEVRDIEGVRAVVNEIEVLPVSPNDDRLRRALYRAIYDFDSPLFRYGVGSRQAIHIVVKDGRVTLEGVVDSDADRQLAYTRARGVPGTFGVDNQLRVDAGRAY